MSRLQVIRTLMTLGGASLIYTAGIIEGVEITLKSEKKRKQEEKS